MNGLCIRFILLLLLISTGIHSTDPLPLAGPIDSIELDSEESLKIKAHIKDHSDDISQSNITLSAECEPNTTVAGCVNVVSGHFFQIEQDLKGNTIDPIQLTRYYDSGSQLETFVGTSFGSQFPLIATDIQKGAKHSYVLISERDGFLIPYRSKHLEAKDTFKIDPRIIEKGYTNLNRVGVSGHANFINWRADYYNNEKGKSFIVKLGDGSTRLYKNQIKLTHQSRFQMGLPMEKIYLLTEEVKANGNKLRFKYKMINDKPYLYNVKTLNRSESAVLNELNLAYSDKGYSIVSSCHNTIEYSHYIEVLPDGLIKKRFLKRVKSNQQDSTRYKFESHKGEIPLIVKVDKPEGRAKEIRYNHRDQVEKILEPLGPNGELITSYRFDYEKHYTKTWNALRQLTCYRFDSNQRLSSIDSIEGDHRIIRQKVFRWSHQPGQEGWLNSKSIRIGEKVFCLTQYEYDAKGNITKEKLYGNLTGEKPKFFASKQLSEMDLYVVQYEYSSGSRNLLISKQTPEGLKTTYAYLPGTHLCIQELESYHGKIEHRIFRTYDENGEIQQWIEDDGSGQTDSDLSNVTFRRLKSMIAETNKEAVSFGKPKIIVESYLQGGTLIPLKRTELTYDNRGNEIQKKVISSQNNLSIVHSKLYDEQQRIVQETDPLGHTTHYSYDRNNNKIQEWVVGSGKSIHYTYDFGNRLIQKREEHSNGTTYTTRYSINTIGQIVSKIDPYDHETSYQYDRLGRQISCTKPIIQNAAGIVRPTFARIYNTLDHVKSETDENGHTTLYERNIRGQPTRITYPDQSVERFIYYPCGWLKQRTYQDGTTVAYQYDPKGHLLSEKTYDSNGNLLKQLENGYKGDLQIYQKDAMGIMTTYHYDGAGRKIAEQRGDKCIQYGWDDFNRLILKKEESQCEITQYDALDRVISVVLQDTNGHIYSKELFEYDMHGNQIKKSICHSDDQIAHTGCWYESDGVLRWTSDALGNTTTQQVNHHHHNGIGQRVRSWVISDPLGRLTFEAEDTFHRVVRKDEHENGMQYSCTHYDYDAAGHQIKQYSLVMKEGQVIREYGFERSFNSRGWLISETETPQGATTRLSYDSRGRLIQKIKPDGVFLNYSYDALGRMISRHSSDGTIHYDSIYDRNDNLLEIHDRVHHTIIKREYDLFNRLVKEELSSTNILRYQYDLNDRLTELTLPDQSKISYIYDSFHLKKITRTTADGDTYEIECHNYDLKGHLLNFTSPIGMTQFSYDLLNRNTTIKTPYGEISQDKFDAVGNLLELSQTTPSEITHEQFTYDRFNQLTSESLQKNHYEYDCIGNCLKKNENSFEIDLNNQIISDGNSRYSYDPNGNLLSEDQPSSTYRYDALNRLISCDQNGDSTLLDYDSFGRCLNLTHGKLSKQLIYQKEIEIGSLVDGKLHELKLVHPQIPELTFALELNGEVFFTTQDHRKNITALYRPDGTVAQSYRYSAFGLEGTTKDEESLFNPWRFANRRELAGLILFSHRLYNPTLMRWQTTDPLGFEDGLNRYAYVHNNPFIYSDPSGQFAIFIPFITIIFGTECIISTATLTSIGAIALAAAAGWGVGELCDMCDSKLNEDGEDSKKKPDNRTDPENLGEQLTLEEARGSTDDERIMEGKIKDPRYPEDKWAKREHIHRNPDGTKSNIHYWEELGTGERHGFKFKDD